MPTNWDPNIKYYVVDNFAAWNSTLDRIKLNREWAIVRDMDQPGPTSGVMGDRHEVWTDGNLACAYDSLEEAKESLKEILVDELRRRSR